MIARREEVLNSYLAELLTEKGLDADAELILKEGRPDVLIDLEGVRVIIEARSNTSGLEDDTRKRLTQGICSIAVGVVYNESVRTAKNTRDALNKSRVDGFVFYYDRDGIHREPLYQISIDDLAATLRIARQVQVRNDLVRHHVSQVTGAIDTIVRSSLSDFQKAASSTLSARLADALGLKARTKDAAVSEDLLRVAIFILFDAMLFHDVVASTHSSIRSVNAVTTSGRRNYLLDQWKKILHINFEAVFDVALAILNTTPNNTAWNANLETLSQVSANVTGSGVLAKHDFMGRLFHRILLRTTGEQYATFYTAIPSAYLLSRLTMVVLARKFESINDLTSFRAADLACGSGTLLSAVYTATRDNYVANVSGPLVLDEAHRALIEESLYGCDVLDYAAHLTLVTLALHNSTSPISHSNIYRVPIGLDKHIVHLGSLDLLSPTTHFVGAAFGGSLKSKELGGVKHTASIDIPPCDVVIMNPPFSRSAKPKVKFGYDLPAKKLLTAKIRDLSVEVGLGGGGRAGMAPMFIPLALKVAKKDAGVVAFIIPRSMLSGVDSAKMRAMVTSKSEIEMIISNFDPGATQLDEAGRRRRSRGWSFSEETDIGEIMLIARPVEKRRSDHEVRYVNLFRYPANEFEAVAIAREIEKITASNPSPIDVGKDSFGVTFRVKQSEIESLNWLWPCVLSTPDASELLKRTLSTSRLVPFERLAKSPHSFGVDIKDIKYAFRESSAPSTYRILWTHGIAQATMTLDPSQVSYGHPDGPQKHLAPQRYARGSRLLVAERPHCKTTSTFALIADDAILATPLWEVVLADTAWDTLMAMWLNSTYGVLLHLAHGTSSQGEIFKMKGTQLKRLPVPDTTLLDLGVVAALWSRTKDRALGTLHDSWEEAAEGFGARYELDQFFETFLGVGISKQLYRLLASDPVITGQRRA